jgi:glucose-1-phosphate adenylyltransferase
MSNILAIVDATTVYHEMGRLTDHRPIGSVPFLGRYRLIDFTLSNFQNSQIKTVAIYPKRSHRSLRDHVGTGKPWELNRKFGGLFFFPSTYLEIDEEWFISYKRIEDHIEYIKRSKEDYVVITNSYTITNIDFRNVRDFHIKEAADITQLYHGNEKMHMYFLSKNYLIELLSTYNRYNENDIAHTIDVRKNISVSTYNHTPYTAIVDSVNKYYKASLDLINPVNARQVFKKGAPIQTKTSDAYPTRFIGGHEIKHSLVALGCRIEGTVNNSVVGRYVEVGENSLVENSVISKNVIIGSNCVIKNAIIDKNVKINDGAKVIGTPENPSVLSKNSVVNN